MIAPAAIGIDPGPSHDVLRANQLIEAGLWLRLGGDDEGARRLFMRALSHDPTNRRAQEWLAKSSAARASAPASQARPVAVVPPPQSVAEVSIVLLEECAPAGADVSVQGSHITADVLDFLAEDDAEAVQPPVAVKPPAPVQPVAVKPPAPAPARPMTVRALTPMPSVLPVFAQQPASQVVPRQQGVPTLLLGVEDLLALGDVSSAMDLLRKAEELAPGDPRLVVARERCAREQQAALEAKLGDLKRVPTVRLSPKELMQLKLDPRAGFVLSRLDGRMSCEALFSVSGMSRLDTLRVLAQLLDQDVITLR
jgi:hypothetical protein